MTSYKSTLEMMLAGGSLIGTLLFTGQNTEEMAACALEFVKKLFGTAHADKIAKNNHPDLHQYFPEGKTRQHSIASMRALIDEMHLPPYEATKKVFIVHDAERMLPNSSNALLKTFEEPNPDALILLLSTQPDLLLPTIVSRCRIIRFDDPFVKKSQNQDLINLLTTNYDHPSLLKALDALDASLFKEEEEDSPAKAKIASALFEQLLFWYRDRTLLKSEGKPEFLFHAPSDLEKAKNLPLPNLEKVLTLVAESHLGFQRHARLRTCLEHFFLALN